MTPHTSAPSMSIARQLGIWTAMVLVMIANGAFRELVLKPNVDAGVAEAISAVLGAFIVLIGTGIFFRPLVGRPVAELARVSALFVALTVTFEFTFGHWVDGKSWTELLANYEFWNGRWWPFLLALLALTPFIWGRWIPGTRHAR